MNIVGLLGFLLAAYTFYKTQLRKAKIQGKVLESLSQKQYSIPSLHIGYVKESTNIAQNPDYGKEKT